MTTKPEVQQQRRAASVDEVATDIAKRAIGELTMQNITLNAQLQVAMADLKAALEELAVLREAKGVVAPPPSETAA